MAQILIEKGNLDGKPVEKYIRKIDKVEPIEEVKREDKEEVVEEEKEDGKRFRRYQVLTTSYELKPWMIKGAKFVLDKHLYKLGCLLKEKGFNCKIVL